MHGKNINRRDTKTSNSLILSRANRNFELKLADLGLNCSLDCSEILSRPVDWETCKLDFTLTYPEEMVCRYPTKELLVNMD